MPDLPVPRLELFWEALAGHPRGFTGRWLYRLVARRLAGDDYTLDMTVWLTEAAAVACDPPLLPTGAREEACFDSAHLGLPAFWVVGDRSGRVGG